MAIVPKVSPEDWAPLYQAAMEFRAVAPWEWMADSDVFGVLDPAKPEVGYCCILGMRRQVFALCVYLGSEGLAIHQRMQAGELRPGDLDMLCAQKCLMASFEDGADLAKEDKAAIKRLGLKFRGRAAWPCFRSYLPDYAPWFLDTAEVRFLGEALRQAKGVALRFKEDGNLLKASRPGLYLTRCLVKEGEAGRWEDCWLKPEPWQEPPVVPAPVDEMRAAQARKAAPRQEGTWELDVTVLPGPVMDRDRPYLSRIVFIADRETGFVYGAEAMDPWKYRELLAPYLMSVMEKAGVRPSEIWVRKGELMKLLGPNARALDVSMSLRSRLRAVESAAEGLLEYFQGQ